MTVLPLIDAPADEAMEEFLANLHAVQVRRARSEAVIRPKAFDGARLANAFRAKPRPPAPVGPTRRATSAAPCGRCAVRGDIGCAHFLPFIGASS